jgi:hypothetical protein
MWTRRVLLATMIAAAAMSLRGSPDDLSELADERADLRCELFPLATPRPTENAAERRHFLLSRPSFAFRGGAGDDGAAMRLITYASGPNGLPRLGVRVGHRVLDVEAASRVDGEPLPSTMKGLLREGPRGAVAGAGARQGGAVERGTLLHGDAGGRRRSASCRPFPDPRPLPLRRERPVLRSEPAHSSATTRRWRHPRRGSASSASPRWCSSSGAGRWASRAMTTRSITLSA